VFRVKIGRNPSVEALPRAPSDASGDASVWCGKLTRVLRRGRLTQRRPLWPRGGPPSNPPTDRWLSRAPLDRGSDGTQMPIRTFIREE
jgi:hypothetical protein